MDNTSEFFNKMKKIVVCVLSFSSDDEAEYDFGTGVVINKHGFIMTCKHFVQNSNRIKVSLPGETGFLEAKVYLEDPDQDIVILKPKKSKPVSKFCKFGSQKSVYAGAKLFSIHHESLFYGFAIGDVVHPKRTIKDKNYFHGDPEKAKFIQINMHGGCGSCGAPVFNSKGKVVGLICESKIFEFALTSKFLKALVKSSNQKLEKDGRRHSGSFSSLLSHFEGYV